MTSMLESSYTGVIHHLTLASSQSLVFLHLMITQVSQFGIPTPHDNTGKSKFGIPTPHDNTGKSKFGIPTPHDSTGRLTGLYFIVKETQSNLC